MARSKSVRKTKSAASPTMSQRAARWLFRPWRLVVAATVALSLLFWPQFRQKLPKLEGRPEYQVSVEQITVTPPPRWVPPDLVEQVFRRAGLADAPLSLLDPTLSERIAAAFYTHPWIDDVQRVRKDFPAHVVVEVTYRRPVAMVQAVDGYYPVDALGHVLPPQDFTMADLERYPIIEQVSSVPVGGLGEAWGDPAVTGAAQLADVLISQDSDGRSWWKAMELRAILAPLGAAPNAQPEDLEYQIRTAGGSRVLWGRSPHTQHPGELTVEQKLQRMIAYHRDFGSFDDGPVPQAIDIRHWKATRRERLAIDEPKNPRR
ncbi:MAG: hypothetical protein R3C19_14250 [Planctomycetaceae bacterium]